MKTKETLKLQTAIWKETNKLGIFACHEVGIKVRAKNKKKASNEIVDFITYNTKSEWRCYEIKTSKSDFNSKAKHTFVGHFNYYVMPPHLYDEIKNNIPAHIGVYTYYHKDKSECPSLYSIKKAKKQPIGVEEHILIYSLIKSFSREYDKIVKGTRPLSVWRESELEAELKRRKE